MKLKYLAPIILLCVLVTASAQFFGLKFGSEPERVTATPAEVKTASEEVREIELSGVDRFRYFLTDEGNKVNDIFTVTPFYYPNVNFWFQIYTQFESTQVLIHDKNNLSIIYKILDFSSLVADGMNRNVIYVLQNKITNEKRDKVFEDLKFLANNPFSETPHAQEMIGIIEKSGVEIPQEKSSRIKFFKSLRDNIRSQSGQKNFIKDGIVRSLPYKTFIQSFFVARNLPPELMAVPFLESSFNPKAESKVGASGTWQFMPSVSRAYVPKTNGQYDYRSNVGVISVAASYLMAENFKMLKSWDLAVTAYNSGAKHLLKTKKALKREDMSLEEIIQHSDSQHFGFASKNFYSEFLALVHTLAYEEEIFAGIHSNDRYNVTENLEFYLSKCSLRLDKVLDQKQLDDVLFHNHHVFDRKFSFPRGSIFASKVPLPASKFMPMQLENMLKNKPIKWEKFLRNQSCSTK
jgi:membrane-bound lytic murein transglycosylase D